MDRTADDLYALLGITSTATIAEIKSAYRLRAKTTHPDAGGSDSAFREVNRAYEVLAEPTSRAAYDRWREGPPSDGSTDEQGTRGPSHGRAQHDESRRETSRQAEAAVEEAVEAIAHARGWQPSTLSEWIFRREPVALHRQAVRKIEHALTFASSGHPAVMWLLRMLLEDPEEFKFLPLDLLLAAPSEMRRELYGIRSTWSVPERVAIHRATSDSNLRANIERSLAAERPRSLEANLLLVASGDLSNAALGASDLCDYMQRKLEALKGQWIHDHEDWWRDASATINQAEERLREAEDLLRNGPPPESSKVLADAMYGLQKGVAGIQGLEDWSIANAEAVAAAYRLRRNERRIWWVAFLCSFAIFAVAVLAGMSGRQDTFTIALIAIGLFALTYRQVGSEDGPLWSLMNKPPWPKHPKGPFPVPMGPTALLVIAWGLAALTLLRPGSLTELLERILTAGGVR